MTILQRELIEDKHYIIDNETECWNWIRCKSKHGYGFITVGGKQTYAHRLSYINNKGAIPEGLYVCHSCDNTGCINPNHLWTGTAKDNYDDMTKKGRGGNIRKKKLSSIKIENIKALYKDNFTQSYIAKKYNVSRSHINRVINN